MIEATRQEKEELQYCLSLARMSRQLGVYHVEKCELCGEECGGWCHWSKQIFEVTQLWMILDNITEEDLGEKLTKRFKNGLEEINRADEPAPKPKKKRKARKK